MKNKLFWDIFYKKNKSVTKPSPFAKFFYKDVKKINKNICILDVGCGNGRDSLFF